jgi:GxxExxY protein
MSEYLYQDLTYKLRGIFFEVYNQLGPGLPEKIYQKAIIQELKIQKISYETEKNIIVKYKDIEAGNQRLDLLIDDKIIIEIKATDNMHSLFEKQTLAYLKSSGYKLALLVNFGGDKIFIKRYIN